MLISGWQRAAHPLIAPALVVAEYVDPRVGDAGDETGHGTLVASLALYGSLEYNLSSRQPLTPAGGLVSVRVLDHNNTFPDDLVWEEHLLQAMEVAADAGARVINLSLGDARHSYQGPRPTPLAALIDGFIRRRDVVVVISTGNFPPAAYNIDALKGRSYPADLLNSLDGGVLDPASAALALTVGALCADINQGADGIPSRQAEVIPVGIPGAPSPLTRVGPGVMNSIKPDLVAPGGSVAIDSLMSRVNYREATVQVVGAGAVDPAKLLASDAGTSFAAPLVSHAALRVLSRYPSLSANAVRALLLAAAVPVAPVVEGATPAETEKHHRRLAGYGRVSAERAEASSDYRVVLLAEEGIAPDNVHLFVAAMPSGFFQDNARRVIRVAIAYDPPVRATRLDYLADRLAVWAFYGVTQEVVSSAFARARLGTLIAGAADGGAPSELDRCRLDLQPAESVRGRGAHAVLTALGSMCARERRSGFAMDAS